MPQTEKVLDLRLYTSPKNSLRLMRVSFHTPDNNLTPPRGEGGGGGGRTSQPPSETSSRPLPGTLNYMLLSAGNVLQMNYITAVHKLLNALINPRRTCTVRVNVQLKKMEQVARDPLVEGMGKLLDYIQQHLKNKQKHNLS